MFFRVIIPVCVVLVALTLYGQKQSPSPSKAMSQEQMKAYLTKRFHDIPELIAIARCESSFRHTLRDGTIIRGRKNPSDVGVMQINLDVHGKRLRKLKLDPLKLHDNVRYARILFQEKGTQPWRASQRCWGQKLAQK